MRLLGSEPWMQRFFTQGHLLFLPMQASQSFLELNSIIMWLGQSICTSCTV